MLKIYHNPQCKKSRAGLQYLTNLKKEFQVVEYIKNPLSEKEIEKLLIKLNKEPIEIIRTQEDYYKKVLKGLNLNFHEWIRILVENPKLIMRPIIEADYKAVIGDPVENINSIVK